MNLSKGNLEEKQPLLQNLRKSSQFSDDDDGESPSLTCYGSAELLKLSRTDNEPQCSQFYTTDDVDDNDPARRQSVISAKMEDSSLEIITSMDVPEPQFDKTDLEKSNINREENENADIFSSSVMSRLRFCKINPIGSQVIVYGLVPLIIWATVLLIVGKDNLPGGTVFVLVLLEFGGRLLGYIVSLLQMPPMVGMLGLGIAVRNIPYLDLTEHWSPSVSAPIRQIALAVILTRAGFGLDLNTLIKFKWLVLRLAAVPTILEALVIAVTTNLLLGFPWVWGILVGFVVAAVSPAVIVPRILELKGQGYGEKKGIPTVLLAAASLDNVVAISLFGVALGFIFSSNKGTAEMILQCPLEVLSGCGFGFVWGLFTALVFNPNAATMNNNSPNPDESVVKGIFVLSGGIISIFGFKLVNYSGAGALGCIISAFVTSTVWKTRGFQEPEINQIKWGLTFLWKFFEPLLFGVIGCQIVIADLEGHTVLLSVACLVIGAVVRFVVTYGIVSYAGLDVKERFFVAISWIPKATVQAAIGPTALDYARSATTPDAALEQLANQVLTIAVVVILLTAPIGEFLVMYTGPKFLKKEKNIESGSNHLSNRDQNESSQQTYS